ncbi:ClbS/DfsB family four-helix bundle protein [Maritalea sp.]|uniref:ClbS/DfsB family four-helix bundle protein n=1 Tax=Maritalea sp. TaxID=2003361 RepID=UPI003EF49631
MPAATNKTDLLAVTRNEYTKLIKLIDQIDEPTALTKTDDASIKDTIGHRAHWIELFLGWYADGHAEKEVSFPAKGYKWNDLKRYNADLRESQETLSWADAKQLLETNKTKLEKFIQSHSDEELYGGPMKGANNNWTTGRWAEAAGPSHFRSAAKYLRSVLKANKST